MKQRSSSPSVESGMMKVSIILFHLFFIDFLKIRIYGCVNLRFMFSSSHQDKKRGIRANAEPPPRLLKAITIPLGCCGYIQVGYLTCFDAHQDVIFDLRAVIVIDGTYISLDVEDMSNFFLKIRRQPAFSNIPGGEDYLDYIEKESMADFFFDRNGSTFTVAYMNYGNNISYEIKFPNDEMVHHVLSLERTIMGFMNLKLSMTDEVDKLLIQLDELRMKCITSPMHIKILGENTCDTFIIDVATNLLPFFIKYWHLKKNEQQQQEKKQQAPQQQE